MDVIQKMKIAIKNNDDSSIDTLLFISKIEFLKKNNEDSGNTHLFDSVSSMVKDFYKSKYKAPYSKEAESLYGYIGKKIDQYFYNPYEIDLENCELLTDKIVKRMKQIKNSSCSFDYKFKSLILLHNYLKELSPLEENKEADILVGRMKCRKVVMNLVLLLFISYPFWLPNVTGHFTGMIDGSPKELIYQTLMMKIIKMAVFGTAFLHLYLKGIFKKYIAFILVTLLIYTGITIPNYVTDIQTDISQYTQKTVTIHSVLQSMDNQEAKHAIVQRENGKQDTFLFHSALELESNKTYTIRYNRTNIIVDAQEIEAKK